jgi:hypothetical protein
MGIIVFGQALRDDERRRIDARLKLSDDIRKQLIADGIEPGEANARALAKAQETKLD